MTSVSLCTVAHLLSFNSKINELYYDTHSTRTHKNSKKFLVLVAEMLEVDCLVN